MKKTYWYVGLNNKFNPYFSQYNMRKNIFYAIVIFILLITFPSCGKKEPVPVSIVFKHAKTTKNPDFFQTIIKKFEKQNPHIKTKESILPETPEEQYQYYVKSLSARSSDFDVLSINVTWTQEFAHAGWLADLSSLIPPAERDRFFQSTVQAASYKNKIYAVPWSINAGLLYYRNDLLSKYGFKPPKTWDELIEITKIISTYLPELYGFIWQGRQHEGLVCNALEFIWGNGSQIIEDDGFLDIDNPESEEALQFMYDLIILYQISPDLVTSANEEITRHIFAKGEAIFMRGWLSAWPFFQQNNSPVKDKTAVCALPSFPGNKSAAMLDGWQLGINKNSKHPQAAETFIKYLTSSEVQKEVAIFIDYYPTRTALYKDEYLAEHLPSASMIYNILLNSRLRPLSPYYTQIAQVMQPELSAVLSGIKSPRDALEAAQEEIEHLLDNTK